MYGRIDDTWVTLSDSLTTKRKGDSPLALDALRDDTVKYLTYPEDTTTWRPGGFAAIVMTFGRANFPKPDRSGHDETIAVMSAGLQSPGTSAITSLAALLDTLWRPVTERWYTCERCALAHSEAIDPSKEEGVNAPLLNDVDEYFGEDRWYDDDPCWHPELSVVMVCINPTDGVRTLKRDWAATPTAPLVSDRQFQCSEHHDTPIPISDNLNLHQHQDEILSQLGEQFDHIATEAKRAQLEGLEAIGCGDPQSSGPIGGTRSGWLLSPSTGFTRLGPHPVNDEAPIKERS